MTRIHEIEHQRGTTSGAQADASHRLKRGGSLTLAIMTLMARVLLWAALAEWFLP